MGVPNFLGCQISCDTGSSLDVVADSNCNCSAYDPSDRLTDADWPYPGTFVQGNQAASHKRG